MRILALLLGLVTLPAAAPLAVASETTEFQSIDGGTLDLAQWRGQPVLVVNTASRCGFAGQFDGLQDLYDRYRARGLVVVAVPSDDFKQELNSDAAVKEFCELNFDIDLPMTTITHVKGEEAHPFFRQLSEEHGYTPSWNFNKVLIGPDGDYVAGWGSTTLPLSAPITGQIEPLLD
ncbi:glutathione peroxidase [Salipiger sp. PrR002]|uniref:glutathione peroxidase n=1 Tax=Salipiger sp. PrR002 TaxID=2706489 RepID=UPI0013B6550D|nr:glutathione peroxidase [Salipiger sp. PrR002]NDW01063.1 glutathione peroxidase [Salipiger sp. PrR002]NDW58534.1 glutathione peroxidase [Salipiger sp. PrR004]